MLVGGAAARWAQRASAQQQKAAPGNPAPRLDWLARHKEPILEPELPIIDPHHHLWQRPGWRYLLDDLLTDTGSRSSSDRKSKRLNSSHIEPSRMPSSA